jgi:site-specific recombinase XerC
MSLYAILCLCGTNTLMSLLMSNNDLVLGMSLNVKQVTRKEHGTAYQTWMVDGYVEGKRVRIFCKDRAEAILRKSEKETESHNLERAQRYVSTRLSADQIAEAESCVQRLAPKYTLGQATDYFLQHFRAPDFAISVGEASVKYRGAMEGVIRDRSLTQLKSSLGQFERFTSNCSLHEVDESLVERFLQSLRARNGIDKASPKTWNNVRGDLHQWFEWCRAQRYLATNPAAEVKRYDIEQHNVEVLSLEQSKALMQHVAGYKAGRMIPCFALALFAGVRPGGELEKLAEQPEAIDLENKVIRLSGAMSKTKHPRQIKIRANLLAWLKQYPGDVLPENSDRDIKAIRKACKLSHDVLRHTFCSCHVMAFGSFAETAIESGNSEQIIRSHYLNAVPKSQAKAFWKIEPS